MNLIPFTGLIRGSDEIKLYSNLFPSLSFNLGVHLAGLGITFAPLKYQVVKQQLVWPAYNWIKQMIHQFLVRHPGRKTDIEASIESG